MDSQQYLGLRRALRWVSIVLWLFVNYLQFVVPAVVDSASSGTALQAATKIILAHNELILQIGIFVLLSLTLWAILIWCIYRTVLFWAVHQIWTVRKAVLKLVLFNLLMWISVGFLNNALYGGSKFDLLVPSYLRSSDALLLISMFLMAALLSVFLFSLWHAQKRKILTLVSIALLTITAINLFQPSLNRVNPKSNKPNIIILGIDSFTPLHLQHYHPENFRHFTPWLDSLVSFQDALPGVPRTFGSWNNILTGLYPKNNGARFNLTSLDRVRSDLSIAHVFKSNGYRTIFSLDERLFANIDQQYGFDEVVGPRMGVIDFALSKVADLPLNNVVMYYLPMSHLLLPNSYANRSAQGAYLPQHHHRRLLNTINNSNDKPLFLVSHYCLSHYPYFWGEKANIESHQGLSGLEVVHAAALKRSTEQMGWLVSELEAAGYLDNAVLVFLSDHGHDLRSGARGFELNSKMYVGSKTMPEPGLVGQALTYVNGHGVNIFDTAQTQTFLAFQVFRDGQALPPGSRSEQASLVDIAPTLYELTGISPGEGALDGRSLANAILERGEVADNVPRIIESELFFSAIADVGNVDTGKLFQQAMDRYEVSERKPLLQLKQDFLAAQVDEKVRSVVMGPWQLALLPERRDRLETPLVENYEKGVVLFNRDTGQWTDDLKSDFTTGVPIEVMVHALQSHYREEFLPWAPIISEAQR